VLPSGVSPSWRRSCADAGVHDGAGERRGAPYNGIAILGRATFVVARRKSWGDGDGGREKTPVRVPSVRYPERDGKPMAETQVHAEEIIRLMLTLRDRYAARPDVYVWGDLLLYYEEGNPKASVAPDVFVAVGAAKEPPRRIYKLWEEGVPPTIVIEVTSASTRREDLGRKRDLYARLGVSDYFLYDPLAEYLDPPLQGFTLRTGAFVALQPDESGALRSDALGLRLRLMGGRLQLLDAATGARLLSPDERLADAQQRIAELEAELRRREPR
jgi:Uma2 family endonuclease